MHRGTSPQHIFSQRCPTLKANAVTELSKTKQESRDQDLAVWVYTSPNVLAWVGSVSVDFGKAADLTQLKAEVLTISRKVLEQAL